MNTDTTTNAEQAYHNRIRQLANFIGREVNPETMADLKAELHQLTVEALKAAAAAAPPDSVLARFAELNQAALESGTELEALTFEGFRPEHVRDSLDEAMGITPLSQVIEERMKPRDLVEAHPSAGKTWAALDKAAAADKPANRKQRRKAEKAGKKKSPKGKAKKRKKGKGKR